MDRSWTRIKQTERRGSLYIKGYYYEDNFWILKHIMVTIIIISVPPFGTCLCSNCWDHIPRTCHVFTRLFTLNTPWYFLDFASNSNHIIIICMLCHTLHLVMGRDMTQSYANTPKRQAVQVKVTQWWYKTFDYTTVTDPLGTVSWSDNSHPSSVVYLRFNGPTFLLPKTTVK